MQGLGAAGLVATGLGLVATVSVHERHRAASATWWGASMGAGIALGPLLTGLLDLGGLWRLFYRLLALAGVGVAVVAHRFFVETRPVAARRVDVLGLGLVTMTGGFGLVLMALVEVRGDGHGRAAVEGAVGLLLLTAFVVAQLRGRHPMLDPHCSGAPTSSPPRPQRWPPAPA